MNTPSPLFAASSIERQFAHEIVRRLSQHGFTSYYAGGCVRDALLGIPPKDFDVATSATPDHVRNIFGESNTQAVGEAFGVVIVKGRLAKQKCQVEVATFRTDGSYSDGRRPDWVEYASAQEDAQRRDFSINGLFYDPLTNQVIDYVDGQSDLKNRILRAIGNPKDRIREDHLRMLRAVRFAARYELQVDPVTQTAIRESSRLISNVSGERIGNELTRILEHPNRIPAWNLLNSLELLTHLAPELPSKSPLFESLPTNQQELPLILASLLHPWAPPHSPMSNLHPDQISISNPYQQPLENIRSRWKLPNAVSEATKTCICTSQWITSAHQYPWSIVQPNLLDGWLSESVLLAKSLCNLHNWPSKGIEQCLAKLNSSEIPWNPPPLIVGADLIEAGLKPSPLFGKLLLQVRQLQLDEQLLSKEQALQWLRAQLTILHDRK